MVSARAIFACAAAFVATNLHGCGGGGDDTTTSTTTTSTNAVTTTVVLTTTRDPNLCAPEQKRFGHQGCFYKCESDLTLPMVAPSKKGLALDDTTLHWCPGNMHFHWPNTDEPVMSFRMFKSWAAWWNEPFAPPKEQAWAELARYLNATHAKVLVGTQISCNETEDDADWENVKEMIKIFGPENIMGLAIGNELELMWTHDWVGDDLPACLDRVWNQLYFQNKFHSRVSEFDAMGGSFKDIPVTSVFGGFILASPGMPFYEVSTPPTDPAQPGIATVSTFVMNVTQAFGTRYVHTLNIYPYFEVQTHMDASGQTCHESVANAMCFDTPDPDACIFTWMTNRMRARLDSMGNASSTLWIGETGWSNPKAKTLNNAVQNCDEWSSSQSFTEYYAKFLEWDLSMEGTYPGPDHVFYFTMRDSDNFGVPESFGLVGGNDSSTWCTNTECKISKSSWNGTTTAGPTTTTMSTTTASTAPTTTLDPSVLCCWNAWGGDAQCAGYPGAAGDNKGFCNNDWSRSCQNPSDCFAVTSATTTPIVTSATTTPIVTSARTTPTVTSATSTPTPTPTTVAGLVV